MRKRLLAVAAAALLPAVGLLIYNEFASRQQRAQEIHYEAAQAARLAASEVERILEGARSLLIAVAAMPTISDLNQADCTETLRRVTAKLTQTGAILIIGTNGRLVCDSQGHTPGTDFSDRSYVQEGLRATDLVVGNYTKSKLTDATVLPISFPLRQNDKTVGVVATGIRLSWLQERVAERGLAKGSAVTIADRDGVILARFPQPNRFVGTKIPDGFQYLLKKDVPGTLDVKSQDGTERILGYEPISPSKPFYVSAGISKAEAFAEVNRVTLTSLAMLLLSTLVAILAAHWVGSRFILDPIQRIVHVLDRWQIGETTVRTGMKGAFELNLVGHSLDNLLEELERQRLAMAAIEEKRTLLARELSHRVKNTLSVVSAIARQSFKNAPNETEAFGQRIRALSGVYDILFSAEWKNTDISTVVTNTLKPYGAGTVPRVRLMGPDIPLGPEAALGLSLVIHELATNALKYGALSGEDGYVSVKWEWVDAGIRLCWQEQDGPPVISPAKEGFGSKLIRSALPSNLKSEVKIDYLSDGLRFILHFQS